MGRAPIECKTCVRHDSAGGGKMIEWPRPVRRKQEPMIDNQVFRELSERLAKIMPMAEDLRADARTRIEQVLKKSLEGLDVLTREEFAVQAQALERAEQRIMELENTLTALEAKIADSTDSSA